MPAIIKLPVVIQIAPPRPKKRPKTPEITQPTIGTINEINGFNSIILTTAYGNRTHVSVLKGHCPSY